MTKLYVVKAGYGAYSDRQEWSVAAYASEDKANEHALRGNNETGRQYDLQPKERSRNRFSGSGDWRVDFEVEEVDLLTEVPE